MLPAAPVHEVEAPQRSRRHGTEVREPRSYHFASLLIAPKVLGVSVFNHPADG